MDNARRYNDDKTSSHPSVSDQDDVSAYVLHTSHNLVHQPSTESSVAAPPCRAILKSMIILL